VGTEGDVVVNNSDQPYRRKDVSGADLRMMWHVGTITDDAVETPDAHISPSPLPRSRRWPVSVLPPFPVATAAKAGTPCRLPIVQTSQPASSSPQAVARVVKSTTDKSIF
ncbi:hypothetical protein PIB30_050443, partial [Stylosanthes scabra]|nr:hypothetical protein [Stylosanthes scabra]